MSCWWESDVPTIVKVKCQLMRSRWVYIDGMDFLGDDFWLCLQTDSNSYKKIPKKPQTSLEWCHKREMQNKELTLRDAIFCSIGARCKDAKGKWLIWTWHQYQNEMIKYIFSRTTRIKVSFMQSLLQINYIPWKTYIFAALKSSRVCSSTKVPNMNDSFFTSSKNSLHGKWKKHSH